MKRRLTSCLSFMLRYPHCWFGDMESKSALRLLYIIDVVHACDASAVNETPSIKCKSGVLKRCSRKRNHSTCLNTILSIFVGHGIASIVTSTRGSGMSANTITCHAPDILHTPPPSMCIDTTHTHSPDICTRFLSFFKIQQERERERLTQKPARERIDRF